MKTHKDNQSDLDELICHLVFFSHLSSKMSSDCSKFESAFGLFETNWGFYLSSTFSDPAPYSESFTSAI